MNAPMPGETPLPLFGEPDLAPATTPKPSGKPEWKRVNTRRRPRCGTCLAMQAAGTLGHMAESARWQRTTPDSVMLLCAEHADPIMTADNQEGR